MIQVRILLRGLQDFLPYCAADYLSAPRAASRLPGGDVEVVFTADFP